MKFLTALACSFAAISSVLALPHPILDVPSSTVSVLTSAPTPSPSQYTDGHQGHAEAQKAAEEAGEELKTYIGLWDPAHDLTPEELFAKAVEAGVDADKMTIFQNSAFSGFSGPMNNHCIRAMSTFDGLAQFEPAIEVFASDVQVNAPWGLQRMSQGNKVQDPPRDPSLVANNDFRYSFNGNVDNLGKDVDIYILDTGINVNHIDFDGRAKWGFTVDTETDEQGHG